MAGSRDAGGSKASRSLNSRGIGLRDDGWKFRQSGRDAGGSKASRDMVERGIGIGKGQTLGDRDGDAGGPKGRGG